MQTKLKTLMLAARINPPSHTAMILAAIVGFYALPILAQSPSDTPAVERELEEIRKSVGQDEALITDLDQRSDDISNDLDRIREDMIAASAKAQPIEAEIASLETQIGELSAQTALKESELEKRGAAMAGTLAALQRMALRPPAALLVSPGSANDIVRTGLLMRTAMPAIEAEAAALRTEMDEIAALRTDLGDRRQALSTARANLTRQSDRLSALSRSKQSLLSNIIGQNDDAQIRIAEQAARTADLEALLTELIRQEAVRRAAAAVNTNTNQTVTSGDARIFELLRPVSGAEGEMASPTIGRILHRFGDAKEYGGTHHGMTFTAPPGARIVAPWDGKVVFAGPFQNFGLILIIEHGEGYHSLLAGFAEVSAVVGQWVLTGEPVGTAPQHAEAGRDGREPSLYVELRENGSPINPLPWLAAHNDRTQG